MRFTMAEVKGAADGKKVKMIIKNKIQGASR
jgi:Glu-tRNA(Gln) amidotransferase subunit E-like FAD-binding protein